MDVMMYALGMIAAVLAFEAARELLAGRRVRQRASARRRLQTLGESLEAPGSRDERSLLRSESRTTPLAHRLFGGVPGRSAIQLRLYRAGLTITPERLLVLSAGLGAAGFAVGTVFFGEAAQALLLAGLGLLPWVHAGRLAAKRRQAFEQQFPDALDLLIRALRAGHSLSSGFAMIGKEMPDPIGTEFAQLSDQIQLGKSTQSALDNLVHRVDSADLPFFATAVAIQQETGSNLAEVLENLSGVMRERFKVLGKVRALTAMGRASAAVLAAWPFITVLILYLVNPTYVEPLWAEPQGHTLVFTSVVMVAVGYVLCRKLATVRV